MDSDTYKIVIKLSGQFSNTCGAAETNSITIQIAGGYTSDSQTITLTAPAGGGSREFLTSSNYFAANSGGDFIFTISYAQAGSGACENIEIWSVVVVGYICDGSCDACSITTSCSCLSDQYLSVDNICEDCPSGCTACTPSACSTCDGSHYLLGTSCT